MKIIERYICFQRKNIIIDHIELCCKFNNKLGETKIIVEIYKYKILFLILLDNLITDYWYDFIK